MTSQRVQLCLFLLSLAFILHREKFSDSRHLVGDFILRRLSFRALRSSVRIERFARGGSIRRSLVVFVVSGGERLARHVHHLALGVARELARELAREPPTDTRNPLLKPTHERFAVRLPTGDEFIEIELVFEILLPRVVFVVFVFVFVFVFVVVVVVVVVIVVVIFTGCWRCRQCFSSTNESKFFKLEPRRLEEGSIGVAGAFISRSERQERKRNGPMSDERRA